MSHHSVMQVHVASLVFRDWLNSGILVTRWHAVAVGEKWPSEEWDWRVGAVGLILTPECSSRPLPNCVLFMPFHYAWKLNLVLHSQEKISQFLYLGINPVFFVLFYCSFHSSCNSQVFHFYAWKLNPSCIHRKKIPQFLHFGINPVFFSSYSSFHPLCNWKVLSF